MPKYAPPNRFVNHVQIDGFVCNNGSSPTTTPTTTALPTCSLDQFVALDATGLKYVSFTRCGEKHGLPPLSLKEYTLFSVGRGVVLI